MGQLEDIFPNGIYPWHQKPNKKQIKVTVANENDYTFAWIYAGKGKHQAAVF